MPFRRMLPTVPEALRVVAVAACLSMRVDAMPQPPVSDRPPISVARVREALKTPSRLGLTFYDRRQAIHISGHSEKISPMTPRSSSAALSRPVCEAGA